MNKHLTKDQLIETAASVINSRKHGDYTVGDVGAAVITKDGNIYTGVCIDTSSSMGFCAEHNAIGDMITAGETKIDTVVATWQDDKGNTFVIPPCGRCREFMKQIDADNLNADVILSKDKIVKLEELLPYHDSWEKVELS